MLLSSSILRRAGLVALAAVMVLTGFLVFAQVGRTTIYSMTWTLNADFDQGVLQSVEHNTVADQLQISKTSSTFPIMWIANAGEDTVSKINTDNGAEVGRYRTWFWVGTHGAWSGPAPSRTAVDQEGNVFVLNRHFDGRRPVLMKILSTGGIDRNSNGQIDTSASGSDVKPLVDNSPANGRIDPAELQDERVAWAVEVGNPNGIGRSLAIGTDGNVWVGTYNDSRYYKVSASDGSLMAGPYSVSGVNPYGSAVDPNGILWSASLSNRLGRLDTSTGTAQVFYHNGQDYGIAVGNGKVYQANLSGYTYSEFTPGPNTFAYPAYSNGIRVNGIGVSVDQNGDIFVSQQYGGVRKFRPDGTQIWFAPSQPGTGEARGAIVDNNGHVWVNHLGTNNVSKFNGATGAPMGVFPVGLSPYTYSDATGLSALTITPTGYWTVIFDSGIANTAWGTVSWNGSTPPGAGLEVKVRSANTQSALDLQLYQTVGSGVQFNAAGQFIQIQVKFTPNTAGTSPVLNDLTVQSILTNQPPTANAGGPYSVPEGGSVALSGTGSDPDGDPLTYAWDLNNDGTFETAGQNPTFSAAGRDGPSSQQVVLQVTDDEGASATSNATITITNVAPAITSLSATPLVALGNPTSVDGAFTDAGIPDTHTVTVDWGDSTSSAGAVTESNGSGTFSAQHTYTLPGAYTIKVTVADDDGGVVVKTIDVIVTAVGKMTGGGRVNTGAVEPPKGNGKPQPIQTSHGFELFLNPDLSFGGNLQYNDHRTRDVFHVTSFTSIILLDNPSLNPGNPAAKFDTAVVTGIGRLNQVDGVQFRAVITDNGEPGKTDTFTIAFPGGQNAGISGPLEVGNHQAHPLP